MSENQSERWLRFERRDFCFAISFRLSPTKKKWVVHEAAPLGAWHLKEYSVAGDSVSIRKFFESIGRRRHRSLMWQCPSCSGCRGHDGPPLWLAPKSRDGDTREIYKCAFCDWRVCICCYMEHNSKKHPELYRL